MAKSWTNQSYPIINYQLSYVLKWKVNTNQSSTDPWETFSPTRCSSVSVAIWMSTALPKWRSEAISQRLRQWGLADEKSRLLSIKVVGNKVVKVRPHFVICYPKQKDCRSTILEMFFYFFSCWRFHQHSIVWCRWIPCTVRIASMAVRSTVV